MAEPPVPEHGAGADPDREPGLPDRDPGLPGGESGPAPRSPRPRSSRSHDARHSSRAARGSGSSGPAGPSGESGAKAQPGRDPRLAAFTQDGAGDLCPPGPDLAATIAALSGQQWRCPGATDDELTGLLGRWAATESWAVAGKLGVIRELLRRRALRIPGTIAEDGLPEVWEEGAEHEVAAALHMSPPAAARLVMLAWTLQARLPGTGAALSAGVIDYVRATIIADELAVLDDEQAAAAEKLILGDLAGKTPGQLRKLAMAAVDTIDPQGARKRREHAEREEARVRLWREHSGAAALAAYGLPTDAALCANASIGARADQYKTAGISPDATMDQLRVLAFCDILNGITADQRITQAHAEAEAQTQTRPDGAAADPEGRDDASGGNDRGDRGDRDDPGGHPDSSGRDDTGDGGGPDGRPGDGGPGSSAPDNGPDGGAEGRPDGSAPDNGPDGGAEGRPGGSAPDNGPDGGAEGRPGGSAPDKGPEGGPEGGPGGSGPDGRPGGNGPPVGGPAGTAGPALPSRPNLTIPLATLLELAERPGEAHGLGSLDPALARDLAAAAARSPHSQWCITVTSPEGYAIGHGCAKPARSKRGKQAKASPPRNRDGPWAFTPRDDPGPADGYGNWTLTLPGGTELAVTLGALPVTDCDHRYETHGYQPSDLLRHLVQVRDGECTFPPCSRHARESDFEHAIPFEKGGRTCMCNAGARSRRCHRIKQSRGWSVSQPRPGWHVWTTPSGRIYAQGPAKYPA